MTDITAFDHLSARMPSDDELERGYPAGVPVVVMHQRGLAGDMVYRSDLWTFTIDQTPAADPDGTRAAIRRVIHFILEDLHNSADDLNLLARAIGGTGPEVARLLARMKDQRDDDLAAVAALNREREKDDGNTGT